MPNTVLDIEKYRDDYSTVFEILAILLEKIDKRIAE